MCEGKRREPIKLYASETSKHRRSNVMTTSLSLPSQQHCQVCEQVLNTERENKGREGHRSAEDVSASSTDFSFSFSGSTAIPQGHWVLQAKDNRDTLISAPCCANKHATSRWQKTLWAKANYSRTSLLTTEQQKWGSLFLITNNELLIVERQMLSFSYLIWTTSCFLLPTFQHHTLSVESMFSPLSQLKPSVCVQVCVFVSIIYLSCPWPE